MLYSLEISDVYWQEVHTIGKGTVLQKGRHGEYHNIIKATGTIGADCGVYCWSDSSSIYYIGSFAHDSTNGRFHTNLSQRVHNYLQNHRVRVRTGQMNTNLMVFQNLNKILQTTDAKLRVLSFGSIQLGLDRIGYSQYKQDADTVHAVERLLICVYRKKGECPWNRS